MQFKYPLNYNYESYVGGNLDKTFGHLLTKYRHLDLSISLIGNGKSAITSDKITSDEEYNKVFIDFVNTDIYLNK